MLLAPWWIGVALADPQKLELHPTPDAQVMLLGRTRENYAEIGVYNNHAPIGIDVRKWRPVDGLVYARFMDSGGGTQFVVLEVEDGRTVELVHYPDRVELRIVAGEAPAPAGPLPVPSIEDLIAGVPFAPSEAPQIDLHPLLGNARTYGPRVPVVRLEVDEPELDLPPGWEQLAPVEHPTWDDIRRWQKALAAIEDPHLKMVAFYRLGDAHRAIGLPREARYYFEQASQLGMPPAAVLLRRAEAALMVRDYEDARYSCLQAWRRDARDGQVLACLGLLSLQTGGPTPGETGRALAQAAQTTSERLVAGELLLRGGRFAEAVAPLQTAALAAHGSQLELVQIALGDAWLLQGEVDRAHKAYLDAPHVSLDGVIRARELMVRMIQDGVRYWPNWVPEIDALAREGGPQAAEALFLLAQVNERFQDHEAAAAAYAALWDLYPMTRSSDVPTRLLTACADRIGALARDGRGAELISVYDNCWRPELTEHVTEIAMFDATVDAFAELGLPEDALTVQLQLTSVLAAVGREDPLQIARLADLHVDADRPEQALDTVRYGRLLAKVPAEIAQLDLAEGRALLALDRRDEALQALTRAATDPTLRPVAERRLAVAELRSGACEKGLAAVHDGVLAAPMPEEPPGEVELLALRCAARLEKVADVLVYADLAVQRSQDEWTPKEARWVATLVGRRAGVEVPDALRSDAPALEKIRAEDASHAAFLAAIADWERGEIR